MSNAADPLRLRPGRGEALDDEWDLFEKLFTNDDCHNCSQITNTNVVVASWSLGVSENVSATQNPQNSETPSSEGKIPLREINTCLDRAIARDPLEYWAVVEKSFLGVVPRPASFHPLGVRHHLVAFHHL